MSRTDHDLDAQLTLARDDLRHVAQAIRHAYDDHHLGYGARGYDPTRTPTTGGDPNASPALSYGTPPTIRTGVHSSLQHIARAHWLYGELPDGQTIWPTTTVEDAMRHRDQAVAGPVWLDLCLAQLQRNRDELLGQEISVALDVAEQARAALVTLPPELWRRPDGPDRPCIGCGRQVQDQARHCWACRQKIHRAVKRGQAHYISVG